ncbi:hypothetical protein [Burkholderia pseudomallei]|uniref:hypothetical protein n=1 Tax=Burkholderia pseudomallei TaxID=28450 RepID=UPI0001631EA0|nr:hypothetical protein [Burkholderia pseudomallei]AIS47828.1 hypothetical protein DR61_1279 [Burkholderia pseudomallei]KGD20198.1 hypothetical protein DR60_4341 [Burkholderia pseudomallei]ONE32679.1 hypothetical protein AQ949_25135 [Burkholderia pseudomallei]ONE38904.1 hypothetical protein AQ950_12915 [Burkholderia pseudomallei]CAJ2825696.1 Uncharacterised protein [Burkholderia pseudomallei]
MQGIDRILAALFLVAAVVATGAGLYAKAEHARAEALRGEIKKVSGERDGLRRALDAQAVTEKKAQERRTASTRRLSEAAKANPAAAQAVVPESIWEAIYGDAGEGK